MALGNSKPVELQIDGGAQLVDRGRRGAGRQRRRGAAHARRLRLGDHRHLRAAVVRPRRRGRRGRRPHHRRAHRAPGRHVASTWRRSGIKIRGRKSTPGRYFQVANPGTGWGGTDITDPLSIVEGLDAEAWRGPATAPADGLDDRRGRGVVRARRRARAAPSRDAGRGAPRRRAHRRELRAVALLRCCFSPAPAAACARA